MARPFIIPIFLPHMGCPHRCLFCNQHSLSKDTNPQMAASQIRAYAEGFLSHKGKHRGESQLAFYGGNFLGLEKTYMKALLDAAAEMVVSGMVQSIRISTRPDSITEENVNALSAFPVSTVELGVQSLDDHVLSLSNRGHTAADTETAVRWLRSRNYQIGLQLMVGLPGDCSNTLWATILKTAALRPDFVRIYPTLVLNGSPLARRFEQGRYVPLDLPACTTLVKDCLLFFWSKQIPVIRMGIQASQRFQSGEDILAGPYHPAFGHLVLSEIFLDAAVLALKQDPPGIRILAITVHPKNISRMVGMNRDNLKILKEKYRLETIDIRQDPDCPVDELVVNNRRVPLPVPPEERLFPGRTHDSTRLEPACH